MRPTRGANFSDCDPKNGNLFSVHQVDVHWFTNLPVLTSFWRGWKSCELWRLFSLNSLLTLCGGGVLQVFFKALSWYTARKKQLGPRGGRRGSSCYLLCSQLGSTELWCCILNWLLPNLRNFHICVLWMWAVSVLQLFLALVCTTLSHSCALCWMLVYLSKMPLKSNKALENCTSAERQLHWWGVWTSTISIKKWDCLLAQFEWNTMRSFNNAVFPTAHLWLDTLILFITQVLSSENCNQTLYCQEVWSLQLSFSTAMSTRHHPDDSWGATVKGRVMRPRSVLSFNVAQQMSL